MLSDLSLCVNVIKIGTLFSVFFKLQSVQFFMIFCCFLCVCVSLSVEEHFMFYGQLKGLSRTEAKEQLPQ